MSKRESTLKKIEKVDEDTVVLDWIRKHADIEEIDDIDFREAIFSGVTKSDSSRRFEIHNTDLIYCLRAAWADKVFIKAFSEIEHSTIFKWISRKGIEVGIIRSLRSIMPQWVKTQKLVTLGHSKGSMDLDYKGQAYEITTRLFYGSQKNPRPNPPPDKVLQLISYIEGDNKAEGKVKVYILVPPKETKKEQREEFNFTTEKDVTRFERTWTVKLKDHYFKQLFIDRGDLLYKALETGDWKILPMCYFSWKCKDCNVSHEGRKMLLCEFMDKHPDIVEEAWKDWRFAKATWHNDRWKWKVQSRLNVMMAFENTYGRKPTTDELNVFYDYIELMRNAQY